MAGLVDRWGRPIERRLLDREIAAPTLAGVRSPLSGYPADGLDPRRLAAILREADAGDGVRYFELAETLEEREPHYASVLRTRRSAVCQMEVTVEAASDAAEDVARADRVRAWLDRDELADEMFDILDCIGKGVSFTEIIWDASGGQWQPARLERRDQRWFRWDRADLATPLMLADNGAEEPLPGAKFIVASGKAKSGLPLRSGVSRIAAWCWMFAAYNQRDWQIFTQTYGQPLRLGKYGSGASDADRDTLFRAVANIAGDCAAIIPESMAIEFVEPGAVGATGGLYRERADWLNHQLSKLVLGQTATTDAVTGGLGSGKEHREVQQDLKRADARALAAVLNRDLIRPWMQLEFGPGAACPRLRIDEREPEDLEKLARALGPMIDRGLRVAQSHVRERFGLPAPEADGALMVPQAAAGAPKAPAAEDAGAPPPPASVFKKVSGVFKRGDGAPGIEVAAQAERASSPPPTASAAVGLLEARIEADAAPAVEAMLRRIEAMTAAARSLPELREMLLAGFPDLDDAALVEVLGQALLAGHLGGRVGVAEEAAASDAGGGA